MSESKKSTNFFSYLWFSIVLNFVAGILTGVIFLILIFLPVWVGLALITGADNASDFLNYFVGNVQDLGDFYVAPDYFVVLFYLIILSVFPVSYFISVKEGMVRFKIFKEKYEEFHAEKALYFAVGLPLVVSTLDFVSTTFQGIYANWELGVFLALNSLSLVVLFFGYRAGIKKAE